MTDLTDKWSYDSKRRLGQLWHKGLTISTIARDMSEEFAPHTYTRNSVVAMVHRMELPARPSPIQRKAHKKPVQRKKAKRAPTQRSTPPVALREPGRPYKPHPYDRPATNDAERCRWITGHKPKPGDSRVFKSEPAYDTWADAPRCTNARYGNRSWCCGHSFVAFTNFNPDGEPIRTQPAPPSDTILKFSSTGTWK